jgi:hypothetical protein
MSAIILFRSLTYAQRGVYTLRSLGIPATVVKAPPETTDRGCTYAAGISHRSLRRALSELDSRAVPHGRAFVPGPDGKYREAAP